jgi:hypothetical protein
MIYGLELPKTGDINGNLTESDATLREVLRLWNRYSSSTIVPGGTDSVGFLGESFYCTGVDATTARLRRGLGFVSAAADVPPVIATPVVGVALNAVGDISPNKPMVLPLDQDIPMTAPPAGPGPGGNERFDLIEVRYERAFTDTLAELVMDTGTGVYGAQNLDKTLTFDLTGLTGTVATPAPSTTAIGVVVGVESLMTWTGAPGTILTSIPVIPPTTAGYVRVAAVRRYAGQGVITAGDIVDLRPIVAPNGLLSVGVSATIPHAAVAPSGLTAMVPPGFRCCVRRDTDSSCTIFFFIGDAAMWRGVGVPSMAFTGADITTPNSVNSPVSGVFTITGALQDAIATGVPWTPNMAVGIGQPVMMFFVAVAPALANDWIVRLIAQLQRIS